MAERVSLGSASSWFQPRPVPHAPMFVDLHPRSPSEANSSIGNPAAGIFLAVLVDQLARGDACRLCHRRCAVILESQSVLVHLLSRVRTGIKAANMNPDSTKTLKCWIANAG